MIVDTSSECKVIYQTSDDDDMPIGEPALIVNNYSECIEIKSDTGFVNINRSTVNELVRVLRLYKVNKP